MDSGEVARRERVLVAAIAQADSTDDDFDIDQRDKAIDAYNEACFDAGICYSIGCSTVVQWCSYCDKCCVYGDEDHKPTHRD